MAHLHVEPTMYYGKKSLCMCFKMPCDDGKIYYNQFNHRGYNDNLRPDVPPKWNHFFFQTLASPVTKMAVDPLKEKALADYKKKLMEHREVLNEMVWTLKDL